MIVHRSNGRRVHLPWHPLEQQARLLTHRPDDEANNPTTHDPDLHNDTSLAALFRISRHSIIKYRTEDSLPFDIGDRLAVEALNLPPVFLWGDDWLDAVAELDAIALQRTMSNRERAARNHRKRMERR